MEKKKPEGKAESSPMLRKARLEDASRIQKLIKHYAEKHEMLPRSINEIYENIRDFTVIEIDSIVIACGALHVCWDDLAEIKSLAVDPDHIRSGHGSRLVKYAVREAKALGISRLFTLTFQPGFFMKLGFSHVEMNDLPKKVWFECVKCVHFPDCNEEALVREL